MVGELVSLSLFAAFVGFRHGMDSDHIAAIADMVGMETEKKRQIHMGTMYALGHGSIVAVIGLLAILLGSRLPEDVLRAMEILVGASLLILGIYILYSLFNQKEEFRYQSRWQIIVQMVSRFFNKKVNLPRLGATGAFVVGIIHGVGAETPTQVMIISSSIGLDNLNFAILQLFLFVIGLLAATIFVTYLASWGFAKARWREKVYLVLGLVTGLYSLFLGISIIYSI